MNIIIINIFIILNLSVATAGNYKIPTTKGLNVDVEFSEIKKVYLSAKGKELIIPSPFTGVLTFDDIYNRVKIIDFRVILKSRPHYVRPHLHLAESLTNYICRQIGYSNSISESIIGLSEEDIYLDNKYILSTPGASLEMRKRKGGTATFYSPKGLVSKLFLKGQFQQHPLAVFFPTEFVCEKDY